MKLTVRHVLKWIWLWPPYFGAGISVDNYNDDITSITVRMKMRFWNKNYVGTHFGGNLYSMCDPWFMFILLEHLGKECVVWDKGAEIDFVAPGTGTMYATFSIDQETIQKLKTQVQDNQKHFPIFTTQVLSKQGEVIKHYPHWTKPNSRDLSQAIEKLL